MPARRSGLIPWKLLEAAFSRLWLLLIPVVVAPLAVVLMTQSPPEYHSRATVWVSRPANVDPGTLAQSNSWWETPAQTQAQVLRDLLSTESFRADVANAAGMHDPNASVRLWGITSVSATGQNLVHVSARSTNPNEAHAAVAALLEQYQVRFTEEANRTAQLQVEYFSVNLEAANTEMERRRAALAQYVAENPDASRPGVFDIDYQRLRSDVESQQLIVGSLVQSLQNAQVAGASAPQALQATFNVQDPASPPLEIRNPATKRFGYPLIALLFGIGLSASYLYTVFRTDYSIRTSEDLIDLPVPLLGYVPELPKRNPVGLMRFSLVRWFPLGRSRDFARSVAVSLSLTRSGGS